jgi:hypothetical protein
MVLFIINKYADLKDVLAAHLKNKKTEKKKKKTLQVIN